MRQLVLTPGGVRLVRMPAPVARPGTVLVRVNYSAVSIGTEVASIRRDPEQSEIARVVALVQKGRRYGIKALHNPSKAVLRIRQILAGKVAQFLPRGENAEGGMADVGVAIGYSVVGQVIDVGAGINDIAVGDFVACAGAGEASHADIVAVRRNLTVKLPPGMEPKLAATVTLGAIAMQGVRRAEPQLGERIAVIGLGLLGQITADLLRLSGCTVIGLDTIAQRVTRAKERGMDAGGNDPGEFAKLVEDMTGGLGADAVVITAAAKSDSVVNTAIACCRRKGRVILVGDVGLGIERGPFYLKELDVLMSTSYGPGRYDADYEERGRDYPLPYVRWTLNRNMSSYLEQVAKQRIDTAAFIDRIVTPEEAPTLYAELASAGSDSPLGVLIDFRNSEDLPEHPLERRRSAKANELRLKPWAGTDLRVGLVGAGNFGSAILVPAIKKCEGFSLHAVIGRDPVRTANAARSLGAARAISDYQTAVSDPDIDLLVVATRHEHHANQAMAALENGKHVFVEKPLCLNWEELDQIEATCARLGDKRPLLMVGYNRRFSPPARILADELVGRTTPIVLNYRVNAGRLPVDHWTQGAEGGGRNLGEACHIYDLARYLIASPVAAITAAAAAPRETGFHANENFTAIISYEDGSIATITYTALGPATLPKERMELFCGGECWLLDDYRSLKRLSDGKELWSAIAPRKGHEEEMQALAATVKLGGTEPISLVELLETSAVALSVEDMIR